MQVGRARAAEIGDRTLGDAYTRASMRGTLCFRDNSSCTPSTSGTRLNEEIQQLILRGTVWSGAHAKFGGSVR